jgi:hypothetical protein
MINLNVTYGDPDGHLQAKDSVGSISAGNAFQLDLAASLNTSEMYSAGVSTSARYIGPGEMKLTPTDQTVMQRCGYYGVALYQTISFKPSAKVALRTEYFTEYNQGIGAIGMYNTNGKASVMAVTLSGNFTKSNLRMVPEVRLDKTSTQSFTLLNNSGSANHMVSVNLALIYQIPALTHRFKS